ncbi:MAG: DUF2892 domain-containing protein [Candidatus Nanohaloarchaea archaeon]
MEENVGLTDQKVRVTLGAISGLVSLLLLAQSQGIISETVALPAIASPVLGLVAIVLLVTGYKKKCQIYSMLGMDTSK